MRLPRSQQLPLFRNLGALVTWQGHLAAAERAFKATGALPIPRRPGGGWASGLKEISHLLPGPSCHSFSDMLTPFIIHSFIHSGIPLLLDFFSAIRLVIHSFIYSFIQSDRCPPAHSSIHLPTLLPTYPSYIPLFVWSVIKSARQSIDTYIFPCPKDCCLAIRRAQC